MTFTHPDRRVAERAAGEWGVLSVAELRECGIGDEAIARRARSGRLMRVHRGVYAVGHAGLTMRGRFLAAVKACGEGAVLSHRSAAALWDLIPYAAEREPDVTARHAKRVAGVSTHRSNKPPPQIRYDRIPVTTPARALADLSSVLPFKPLRRAVREALARGRITPHEATTVLNATPAPTRSDLEDVVLDLIEQAGLEMPEVNRPLANGLIPDFRWPAHHVIVEADGRAWHDDPLAREDDAARQAALEAQGERVIRVTYAQAVNQPGETVQRLTAAGVPTSRPPPVAAAGRERPACAAGRGSGRERPGRAVGPGSGRERPGCAAGRGRTL
jgi:very-short-patch-repair endonuclease